MGTHRSECSNTYNTNNKKYIRLLEKLLCKHKWKIHFTTELYGETWNGERGVIKRKQTLICESCGKLKQILL